MASLGLRRGQRSSEQETRGKRKRRVANIVLAFGFVFLTAFTIVMTVGFFLTQTEAPTLTACVYAFWGTELVGMLIKRIFDKRKEKEETENVEHH